MSLEDLTEIQLYDYQKQCTLLNKITPTTPIKGPGEILETYAQGQLYAAQYYCIGETANAPAFQNVLTKEWLWWGVQYNAWNALRMTSKNLPQIEPGQVKSVPHLKDDPCGTPLECYQKAIEALREAEKKIENITAYPCNCTCATIHQDQVSCNSSMVYQGVVRQPPVLPACLTCCFVCLGTHEEAAAYAMSHLLPPSVVKNKNTDRLK